MNNKTSTILLAIVLVLVIAVAMLSYNKLIGKNATYKTDENNSEISNNNASSQKTEEVRQLAPDFILYDTEEKELNFSDFKGKNIIINFWASWCGYCQEEMEGFNNVYNEYIDNDNIVFIMLNVTDGEKNTQGKETIKTANDYYESNNFDFPIYYDLDLEGSIKYGANALPLTYFINKEGYVVGGKSGYLEESILSGEVSNLLDGIYD